MNSKFIYTNLHEISEVIQKKYFYHIYNNDNAHYKGKNKGWKLHISIEYEKTEEAFNIIAPILYEYVWQFKIIRKEVDHLNRFINGCQFTVYLAEEIDNTPCIRVEKLITEVTQALKNARIEPGIHSKSDAPLKNSPYFSLRNACLYLGESTIYKKENYILAHKVAQFNPAYRDNPYRALICEDFLSNAEENHFEELLEIEDPKLCLKCFVFTHLHRALHLNQLNGKELGELLTNLASGDQLNNAFSLDLWRKNTRSEKRIKQLQDCVKLLFFYMRNCENYTVEVFHEAVDPDFLRAFDKKFLNIDTNKPIKKFADHYQGYSLKFALNKAEKGKFEPYKVAVLLLHSSRFFPENNSEQFYKEFFDKVNFKDITCFLNGYNDKEWMEYFKAFPEYNPLPHFMLMLCYLGIVKAPGLNPDIQLAVEKLKILKECKIPCVKSELDSCELGLRKLNLINKIGEILPCRLLETEEIGKVAYVAQISPRIHSNKGLFKTVSRSEEDVFIYFGRQW